MYVGVVDYTVGNIGSVLTALRRAGAVPVVIKGVEEAGRIDAVVLPGVGTYEAAYALARQFKEVVLEKPTLAICLGMQLLFESSEEGGGRGLGVFKGRVERIRARKVPNIGWRYTHVVKNSEIIAEGYYYYLHSYGVRWGEDEAYTAYIELEEKYVAAVERGNIIGVQFHPERSGKAGMELIRRFLAAAKR